METKTIKVKDMIKLVKKLKKKDIENGLSLCIKRTKDEPFDYYISLSKVFLDKWLGDRTLDQVSDAELETLIKEHIFES